MELKVIKKISNSNKPYFFRFLLTTKHRFEVKKSYLAASYAEIMLLVFGRLFTP